MQIFSPRIANRARVCEALWGNSWEQVWCHSILAALVLTTIRFRQIPLCFEDILSLATALQRAPWEKSPDGCLVKIGKIIYKKRCADLGFCHVAR
jgi:hypothetical protein